MAKICAYCGSEIGFLSPKIDCGGGRYICSKCMDRLGVTLDTNMEDFTYELIMEWLDDPEKYKEYVKNKEAKRRELNRKKIQEKAKKKKTEQKEAADSWYKAFHTDVSKYSDDQIRIHNAESMKIVNDEVTGLQAYLTGSFMTGDHGDLWEGKLLNALIQQNWIIIRQNEQIIQTLKQNKNNLDIEVDSDQDIEKLNED